MSVSKVVATDNEQALLPAVRQQHVYIATETGQSSFQFHWPGVLTASCGANVDHGVLAVGNNTNVHSDDWKVKNSCSHRV